jgi:hypothetical protein
LNQEVWLSDWAIIRYKRNRPELKPLHQLSRHFPFQVQKIIQGMKIPSNKGDFDFRKMGEPK